MPKKNIITFNSIKNIAQDFTLISYVYIFFYWKHFDWL